VLVLVLGPVLVLVLGPALALKVVLVVVLCGLQWARAVQAMAWGRLSRVCSGRSGVGAAVFSRGGLSHRLVRLDPFAGGLSALGTPPAVRVGSS
jgi:hypothetical protein